PQIVEVGPRDGLQNEPTLLTTGRKIELISRLVKAGLRRIEVASFVHPDRVPQMADAEDVCASLPQHPDVSYIGLVLNQRGLERALATSLHEFNFVVGATDGFNSANQGKTSGETMTEIESMVPDAADRFVTVTISVAFGCPYEGKTAADRVVDLARRAAAAGADEIALGDTIGVAVPSQVTDLLTRVRSAIGDARLRAHFHDTRNTAIANVWAALQAGAHALDSSVGGTGGCPFAPEATGNVATEDVLYLLESSDIATGVDHDEVIGVARWLSEALGKEPAGSVARAGWFSPEG
ncbi:MAG: hydroxymethylglutaryl-CoA lyase, partial [Acidimicrobiia bacterium]|nr:hydroxymethylglutaryl-CoA lyase [Acidimicrobiia bacterium]